MTPLVALALLSAAPTPQALAEIVSERFEAAGRTAPPLDPSLSRAADELARHALLEGLADAAGLLRVTAAVSRQGGWDPTPIVVAIRAPKDTLATELRKQDLGAEPATHAGVGVSLGEERAAVIVILARRRLELEAFPRGLPKPSGPQRLCGVLRAPLTAAELFVTRPGGAVDRLPMARTGERVCASPDFPTRGRHAVEVLATGPRGPEVAALFLVDVGAVRAADEAAQPEPPTPAAARAALLARINALRLQMGRAALEPDEALERVAQAWADRLAASAFFSHVAPDGSTLRDRLTESGYRFVSAGENLGLSSGPLAAHFGIEHSPGHRNNLLEPGHRRLGVGLATRADGLTVLVELFAQPGDAQAEPTDPLAAAYASVNAERARRKLPPLVPSPVLEGLAQGHARAALERDLPKAELPGRAKLHERAFALLDEATSVAVDVVVADTPKVNPDSKNVASPTHRLVGIGLVKGDSPTLGARRYWLVVIYAATRD